MNYESEANKAMQLCPKFVDCSAPICPLDPLRSTRGRRLPDEPKCTISSTMRKRLKKKARQSGAV